LSVPEGFEVEQFPDSVELDEIREFRDRVRDDVRAVPTLVPSLLADEFFGTPEEERFDDEAFVKFFVEPVRVLLPFRRRVVAEVDEVLLCSLTHDVWVESPRVLILCQVGFRDELFSWILE
jgi:hypothetical protein